MSDEDIAAGRVLVAVDAGGRTVGVASVVPAGEAADLDLMFVDPPSIGSGAGRAPSDAIPGRSLPLYDYDLTSGKIP